MASSPTRFAFRRLGLYALILLALGLVSTVVFVMVTEDSFALDVEGIPEVIDVDPDQRPQVEFPVAARTHDPALNRFVDRFCRICTEARYSEFRLMHTRRYDPIPPARFEKIFNAVKRIKVLELKHIEHPPKGLGPTYVMTTECELEDYARRGGKGIQRVQVAITWEEEGWRIGKIPRELQDADKVRPPAKEPKRFDPESIAAPAQEDAASPFAPGAQRTRANQPISLAN